MNRNCNQGTLYLQLRSEAGWSAATLHEAAGQTGALPSALKPMTSVRLCGPAFTVRTETGDNLWLHRAIYQAEPGDILVVDVGTGDEVGYWGEIMTRAAIHRGIGGLVINGSVRDAERLRELRFPVFAHGFCIRGTTKHATAAGNLNCVLDFDGAVVAPGDLLFGDDDGLVVISGARIKEVVAAAKERMNTESEVIAAIEAGATTIDIFRLPTYRE